MFRDSSLQLHPVRHANGHLLQIQVGVVIRIYFENAVYMAIFLVFDYFCMEVLISGARFTNLQVNYFYLQYWKTRRVS